MGRMVGALLAVATLGVVLCTGKASAAEREPLVASLGLVVRRGTLSPTFGGSNFKGDGKDAGGTAHSLSATGVELGILRPPVHVYDFGFDFDVGAFHSGLFFGIGKTKADVPRDPAHTQPFDPTNLTFFRLGVELGSAVWIGNHLRLMAGGMLGFQAMQMNLPGLTTRCKSSTCGAKATALIPWVQPRLSFEVLLGKNLGVGLGGYVGTDVIRPQDIETGITISLRGLEEIPLKNSGKKPR